MSHCQEDKTMQPGLNLEFARSEQVGSGCLSINPYAHNPLRQATLLLLRHSGSMVWLMDMGAVQQNPAGASSESPPATAIRWFLNAEKRTGDPLAQTASHNSTPEEGQAFGPTSSGGV